MLAMNRWQAAVPDRFLFAVKAHRRIAHNRRPDDARQALEAFVRVVDGLGERCGPVLFQVPRTGRYVPGRIESLLPYLPQGWRVAFQFRHPSWRDSPILDTLVRMGAAVCLNLCLAGRDQLRDGGHPDPDVSGDRGP